MVPPSCGSYVFYEVDTKECNLFVPAGSEEAYRTAAQWKEFGNIVPISQDDIDGIESLTPSLSEGEGAWFDLSGRRVQQPRNGIYIKNGKKVAIK